MEDNQIKIDKNYVIQRMNMLVATQEVAEYLFLNKVLKENSTPKELVTSVEEPPKKE